MKVLGKLRRKKQYILLKIRSKGKIKYLKRLGQFRLTFQNFCTAPCAQFQSPLNLEPTGAPFPRSLPRPAHPEQRSSTSTKEIQFLKYERNSSTFGLENDFSLQKETICRKTETTKKTSHKTGPLPSLPSSPRTRLRSAQRRGRLHPPPARAGRPGHEEERHRGSLR